STKVPPPGPGQSEPDPWTAEDWSVFCDERAGIAEHDGRLPRAKAEARAHACCIAEWLWRNPTSSPPGRCLTCAGPDRANDPLLAYGITNPHQNSRTWLHRDCSRAWHADRIADAVAALAAMNIRAAPDASPPAAPEPSQGPT